MSKGSAYPSRKAESATIHEPEILLAFMPPSRGQRRFALAIVLVMSIVFATTIPFVYYPLPKVPTFIPIFETAVFVCDLITASLLFAQFVVSRSRALLVLASGYLFTALIVIPHALTFPDAFAPTGLLGAEPHTAAWLYFVWRLGFALSVIGYVLLKDFDLGTAKYQGSAAAAIGSVIAIVIALVCGLTWVIILQERYLPQVVGTDLMASRVRGIAMVLLGALALALLW